MKHLSCKFFKWKGAAYVVILALFAAMLCLYPGNNIFTWISARSDISRQHSRMRQLDREIQQMQKEIDVLTSDRDSLEKFARENFHFTNPGEEVYLVDDK